MEMKDPSALSSWSRDRSKEFRLQMDSCRDVLASPGCVADRVTQDQG